MELREQLKALIEGGATAPYSLVRSDGTPLVLADDSLVPFFLSPTVSVPGGGVNSSS